MEPLTNKTSPRGCALVTGGARGIGRAVCEALAASGFAVAVNHSSESSRNAAEAVAANLTERFGVEAFAVMADVSQSDQVAAMAAAVEERLGTVAVLVNNAGITRDTLLVRMKEDDFDRVIDVNLKGTYNCCRVVAPKMAKARFGRIINMSSVVGLSGNVGQVNYAASKAGIIGLTKAVAREFAGRNITANAIAPGFIETDMTDAVPEKIREKAIEGIPAKRMGEPDEVAALAAFLAREEAGYITGQVICVDGGMAL